MPSKTNEDKIDDLTKLVSGLAEQYRALDGQIRGVVVEKGELSRAVTTFGRELAVFEQQLKDLRVWKESFGTIDQLKVDLALRRKEVEDLKEWQAEIKKQKDEWRGRIWGVVGPLLGTIVGWALERYFSKPR